MENELFKIVRRIRDIHHASLICAHRGDSQNAPENTMVAFERAYEVGAELIEMDVRETSDGEVVVFHDRKVDRTTNGTGEIQTMSLAEVRALDAGSWFSPRFVGERVPTLDEFLDYMKGRMVPMIELKDKFAQAPKLGRKVVDKLRERSLLEESIVIVRDKERVVEFGELAPELPVSIISFVAFQTRGLMKFGNIVGIDHYWRTVSRKLVEEVHNAGMFITPWTINKKADMRRYLRLGCECLLTDNPIVLKDAIEEYEVELVSRQEHEWEEWSEVELESPPEKHLGELEES